MTKLEIYVTRGVEKKTQSGKTFLHLDTGDGDLGMILFFDPTGILDPIKRRCLALGCGM